MGKKKKNYSNVLWGLDIETSTIDINDDEKCSFMYSFCFGTLNLNNGSYHNEYMGRTYNDLSEFLYMLNDSAESQGETYIIYIHNLSYEMSFFQNNVDFFTDANKTITFNDCIYLSKNKPLFVKINNLEFRCSLQLLSKKIATIGDDIGLPKLDYDYDKLRTPLSTMDSKEIEYNYRDVEIMLRGVYHLYSNNEFITSANDLPYSKTGVMRWNCEHNPEINETSEYYNNRRGKIEHRKCIRLNNYIAHLEKAKTLDQLLLWEKLFQGGLVYSNPKYTSQVVENVASYDFSSDYPFQMLTRVFPSEFKPYTKKDIKKKFHNITKHLDFDNLAFNKLSGNCFNAIIEIDNVKKIFEFQPLSTSKVLNSDDMINTRNCLIINGKILECYTRIKLVVTIVDYIMLKLFYDFDLIKVHYLEIATKYRRSNQYKMNSVLFNARAKIEFKKYNELVENANTFKTYAPDEIANDHYRNKLNACSDYFEQLNTSHTLYQAVKSDLNALYGDNAQHLMRTNYLYDVNAREFIENKDSFEDYQKSRQKTSYIYGLYVPAFARASILYIAYQFCINGFEILYIDTDSIKVKHTKRADKLVADFNKIQLENLGENSFTKFGQLEREYIADKFVTLGTKSYIKMENGTLKATVSGLPNATKIFNELLEYFEGSFDEMIENCYHYGTVFDTSVARKLASKYQYKTYDIDIDGYSERVVSGVVLEPVEVTMRDFNSKTWDTYAHIICNLYNYKYSDFAYDTKISYNNNGDIEVTHNEI